MDLHMIRQELKRRSIYDLPLRVTFYARVSSESDEQLNSLGNQISYYENLIRKNAAWTFVAGYVDEGISAATTKKRDNFHRMVEDAKAGLFDLVITKEITRFARNTLDSIQYTRELLGAGVGVFFQNDNINTFDEDSELRLTIMSGIAQDELRKLSSRVKFGHQQAIKNNVVLGNSRIFGYTKDDGRLVIDEEQAAMVRRLFELYATGEYSMKQIETLFWQEGYRNHNGKKIAHTTMSNMIANPKYKGYYVGNKVKVIDLFTKKQKFLPPEEWVMFKDETGQIVPAIVSEELWDAANAVLKKRSDDVKSRQGICNHANLLTGKLYCTCCGTAYYRRDSVDRQGNKNSKWVCSGKIKNGADSCDSFAIYEEELKPLLLEVFKEAEPQVEALIEEYVEMYKAIHQGEDLSKRVSALEASIATIQKKKQKLLAFNAMGELSDQDFLTMNKECTRELEAAQQELQELTAQRDSAADFKKQIDTVRRCLRQAQADAETGVINKEFVDRYIDKIFATPEDSGTLRLQIKLFTGEVTDKYLTSLAPELLGVLDGIHAHQLDQSAGLLNPGQLDVVILPGNAAAVEFHQILWAVHPGQDLDLALQAMDIDDLAAFNKLESHIQSPYLNNRRERRPRRSVRRKAAIRYHSEEICPSRSNFFDGTPGTAFPTVTFLKNRKCVTTARHAYPLIDNFDRDLHAVALGDSLDDGTDFFGDAALTADNLAHVLRGDPELQHQALLIGNFVHRNRVGIINQILCHIQQEVFHWNSPLRYLTEHQPSSAGR